jgi:alanyl-tRNA synthetase
MTSKEIRQTFLDFFQSKNHLVVASAPMVVKDDPTLMFTNAGMNQFKNIFLGNDVPKQERVVNSQKCLRVSGKHNDLEEVGVDTYHHTMFEMLGNWSFGNYFKEEAISWAWELLTEKYGLNKEDLYVTVFEGDAADKLEWDKEAHAIWSERIDPSRIIKSPKKDNFWEMGDQGPCGPSSEIHVDLRNTEEKKILSGKELVNKDHPMVIEIWNLVFIEFNRKADGSLTPLPKKHVDTGMGFERLAMALQGKQSNYDTDIFQPLLKAVERLTGKHYKASASKEDIAFRVIVDHVRAVSFSIADGQLPSNGGAGYVIRRILRRAIRYGYSFLNQQEAFIHQLVPVLVAQMGEQFVELRKQQDIIQKVVEEEENNFLRTLEKGIQRIAQITTDKITGEVAFELYDTFGFPIDLSQLIASEKGMQVDMKGFEACLSQQRQRSKSAAVVNTGDWISIKEDEIEEFVGYDRLETQVSIVKYRKLTTKEKVSYQLVFNITPFYPEGGGQVGDTGFIELNGERTEIINTKRENNLIVHFAASLPSQIDGQFNAIVEVVRRTEVAYNHSATHLLHAALREVLGKHVEQKGSLVHPEYLRFDFSHFQKVDPQELEEIERKVNAKIRKNLALKERRAIPLEEAKTLGAMALFGEKYGDIVRVIQFGDSIELCGGTHVQHTSQIGGFKIRSESAVAAGVRRIEAITGDKVDAFFKGKLDLLDEINALLKNPKDTKLALQQMLDQQAKLQKELDGLRKEKAHVIKQGLMGKVKATNGIHVLAEKVALDAASIKDLAFQLKAQYDDLFMVLGSDLDGKASLSVLVADKLVKERNMNAGEIVRKLAKEINGGGGGQAFFATAGGKNPSGIERALARIEEFI